MKSQGIIKRDIDQKNSRRPHIFSLKSLNSSPKNKFNIKIDLSCSAEAANSSQDSEIPSPIMWNKPVFNRNGGSFTPAFVIPHNKSQANQNNLDYLLKQKCTKQKQLDEGEGIIIAKPTSTYCSVCKVHFMDYLNHTKREQHRKNIKRDNKKLKMEDLFSYFESYTRNKKTKDTQDISSYETKKKKVRILDDPITFNPIPLSKTIESTANQFSMHRSSIQLKPTPFLQD